MNTEKRGSIAFFTTYRPPVPLEIFSCPLAPISKNDEHHMTDGVSYNYNGQAISPEALKMILKRPKLASEYNSFNVDSGDICGMIFVSERGNLETLHIALRYSYNQPEVKVFSFDDVFGTFNGVRMEDSGCIAGDGLVYISTMEPAPEHRQPWTAAYRTDLMTGTTERLTPEGHADLNPSVSPSGKWIAVASFQQKGGWDGENQDLNTDIFLMKVKKKCFGRKRIERKLVVNNGGWPAWGSNDIIFFHRKVEEYWGVFRLDISSGDVTRVTPDGINAMTPAAINVTTVAVATIRQQSRFGKDRVEAQYRHIELFDSTGRRPPLKITQKINSKADHFNPFVMGDGKRIGYHRCKNDHLEQQYHKLGSPLPDVGLLRVSGAFPAFSKDGSKLAFVDSEFKAIWVADSEGLRIVYKTEAGNSVFSPVWNQDPQKDILYACMGPSFSAAKAVNIFAIPVVAGGAQQPKKLTEYFNNAFPSTNPQGTKLVFRSTRDGGDKRHKNLYIMEDVQAGEFEDGKITRLTDGPWTDTQCQWSPRGDWIVFSSTRDKLIDAQPFDNGLDPGFFAVYLLKVSDPSVWVRVLASGSDGAGHVNHPFFSPDGMSIVVTSDLAAVSVDPISLPFLEYPLRPYGDIFTVDIDPNDITKNTDVKKFNRITHSRYENSPGSWSMVSTQDPNAKWNLRINKAADYTPACPYAHDDGAESWHMTGQLMIPKKCC